MPTAGESPSTRAGPRASSRSPSLPWRAAVCVRAHNASAAVLAERLTGHPRVQQVKCPGLASHPQHELARRQMRDFGGMLSFVVEGDAEATAAVVDRLKLFSIAPSLGGVESLVTQPRLGDGPACAVPAESLEALSVAAVHGGVGVQAEAIRGSEAVAGPVRQCQRQRLLEGAELEALEVVVSGRGRRRPRSPSWRGAGRAGGRQ